MGSQGHRQSSEWGSQHLQKLNQPHGSWQRSIPPPAPWCGRKCSAACFPFLSLPFISFPFYFLVSHRRADSAPLLVNQLAIFFCPFCPQPFLVLCLLLSFFPLQNSPSNCLSRQELPRIWENGENGENEFSLQGLEDGKYKHINIVFILSSAYVCYLLVLSLWVDLYSSPQHMFMVIWFSVMFLFSASVLPFLSSLSWSCPSKWATQLSTHCLKGEGIW